MLRTTLFVLLSFSLVALSRPVLIGGKAVAPGSYLDVVSIMTGNSGCTATIVGPKVIITAAHCAATGSTSKFKVNNHQYEAKMERSAIYPKEDHDVCLGVVSEEVAGVKPASITKDELKIGDTIRLLGYGCINHGGGGGNDGILREGDAKVTGFSGYDVVSSNGAALCYGDSGGPAFVFVGDKRYQVTVNSKGNIKDTNYTTALFKLESQQFLKEFAEKNKVKICGVTADCEGSGPGPGPNPSEFEEENQSVKIHVWDKGLHEPGYVQAHVKMLMEFLAAPKPKQLPYPAAPNQ